jgi:hypothetical protein
MTGRYPTKPPLCDDGDWARAMDVPEPGECAECGVRLFDGVNVCTDCCRVYRCAGGCDTIVAGEDQWCIGCTLLHRAVEDRG